ARERRHDEDAEPEPADHAPSRDALLEAPEPGRVAQQRWSVREERDPSPGIDRLARERLGGQLDTREQGPEVAGGERGAEAASVGSPEPAASTAASSGVADAMADARPGARAPTAARLVSRYPIVLAPRSAGSVPGARRARLCAHGGRAVAGVAPPRQFLPVS